MITIAHPEQSSGELKKKGGKIPPSPALSGTFWRLNVATPQFSGVTN